MKQQRNKKRFKMEKCLPQLANRNKRRKSLIMIHNLQKQRNFKNSNLKKYKRIIRKKLLRSKMQLDNLNIAKQQEVEKGSTRKKS